MTQPQDANAILMGGGSPAIKFDAVGVEHRMKVVAEPTTSQQTDFRTKVPETWPDGSPKMQILVQVATTMRDPQRPEDDGTRTLYIKGKALTDAVRQAIRASGANGLHTGGDLVVRRGADGPAENGLNAPHTYAASYQPPAASFNGVTSPQSAQPVQQYQQPVAQPAVQQYAAPQQQPVQQYAQAPIPQQVPAAEGPQCPPGVDPAMWAQLSPQQRQAVAAASAAQPGY